MANELTAAEIATSVEREITLGAMENEVKQRPGKKVKWVRFKITMTFSTNYKYQTGGIPLSTAFPAAGYNHLGVYGSNFGIISSITSSAADYVEGILCTINTTTGKLVCFMVAANAAGATNLEEIANNEDLRAANYTNESTTAIGYIDCIVETTS